MLVTVVSRELIIFCIEKQREDQTLGRAMVIESSKPLLEGHRNHVDEIVCSSV
jgi:hypothetical protein